MRGTGAGMGDPEGSGASRDYFAGSVAVLFLRRFVEGSTRAAERLFKRTAAWIGVAQTLQAIRSDPFRAACAFLASALLANGLALWWTHRGATPWGIALRLALLCTALLGLACRGGWPAVRETAVLVRLVRFFRKGRA